MFKINWFGKAPKVCDREGTIKVILEGVVSRVMDNDRIHDMDREQELLDMLERANTGTI